jgi:hypothetical protein
MGLLLAFLLTLHQDPSYEAVRKGIAHLKSKAADAGEQRDTLLYTLAQVGVPESDAVVADLLKGLLPKPPETTRSAALQVLILHRLDPAKFRVRIAHGVQFLLDNQSADGQWDAGTPVEAPLLPPEPMLPKSQPREFGTPIRVLSKVRLLKRREGAAKGDAANSLWAGLGLWGGHLSGFVVPPEIAEKAAQAWRSGEFEAADQVSGLAIHLSLGGKKWKQDPDVQKAVERLADPKRPTDARSLATLKRAMMHSDSEKLGGREWWPEGRKILLEAQRPDGSWGSLEDTCAALQYLYVPRYSGIPERTPR